jgi:hypothetical protein
MMKEFAVVAMFPGKSEFPANQTIFDPNSGKIASGYPTNLPRNL